MLINGRVEIAVPSAGAGAGFSCTGVKGGRVYGARVPRRKNQSLVFTAMHLDFSPVEMWNPSKEEREAAFQVVHRRPATEPNTKPAPES